MKDVGISYDELTFWEGFTKSISEPALPLVIWFILLALYSYLVLKERKNKSGRFTFFRILYYIGVGSFLLVFAAYTAVDVAVKKEEHMIHFAKTELRSYAKSFGSTVVPVYSIREIKKDRFPNIQEETVQNVLKESQASYPKHAGYYEVSYASQNGTIQKEKMYLTISVKNTDIKRPELHFKTIPNRNLPVYHTDTSILTTLYIPEDVSQYSTFVKEK
ncbi:hypothetical protein CN507_17875 [Bacillus cereus]|nr:hypothetical protein CN507_17875 [Bacillus cereus]